MLEIIPLCLEVIMIGLTIYGLFRKKDATSASKYIQNNFIQLINPKYNIEISSYYMVRQMDNVKLQNAREKSKAITSAIIYLIYFALIINFISYIKIKVNSMDSLMDIIAVAFIPFRNTSMQLSIFLIILCIIITARGWNKQQSILSNLICMKYFTLKILTDIFSTISFSLVDYSLLGKICANTQNTIYLFNVIGWGLLLACQISWIQFTISKLNKSVLAATTYEEKKKQLLSFVPAYGLPLFLLGLTVYTKFL